MSAEPAELEEDEAPAKPKAGPGALARMQNYLDKLPKPDLYRCRGCNVTVTERDREGHLARCSSRVSSDPYLAFEKRARPSTSAVAKNALRGQSKKRPRRGRVEPIHHRLPDHEPPELEAEPVEAEPVEAEPEVDELPEIAQPDVEPQPEPHLTAPSKPEPGEPMANDNDKDWITRAEAGKLLSVNENRISTLCAEGRLQKRGGGKGHAVEISRASVIAHRAKRDEAPPVKVKTPRRPKAAPKKPKADPVKVLNKVIDENLELREDVIALVRNVERGWMTESQAFEKLREIAEQH